MAKATPVWNQITQCLTRLHIRSFYFFSSGQPEEYKNGLLKAYETASEFIQKILIADSNPKFVVCTPVSTYRMLVIASIILMKVLNSSYSSLVDFECGKRNFNASIRLLRRCSLQDNDNLGRASSILSQLWVVHQASSTIKGEPPRINVKTRLSASILHDTLWMWRRKCSKDRASSTTDLGIFPHLRAINPFNF